LTIPPLVSLTNNTTGNSTFVNTSKEGGVGDPEDLLPKRRRKS